MSYEHLSSKERYVIYHLCLFKLSFREIGRRLGRHHTTIAREVARNGRPLGHCYVDDFAQQQANKRKRQARHYRRKGCKQLVRYVHHQLREGWSPEEIVGRIGIDYPRNQQMRISVEGLYRWVYEDARSGGDLYQCLRWKRKRRKKQCRYGTGRRLLPGRISIHQRPGSIESRCTYGHWEGDTVEGAKGKGGLATHVERKSRYLIAAKLDDKRAQTMTHASRKAFKPIPRRLRKTNTVDNGKEFAEFKALEQHTGLTIYFADPYAPWQRGTNENTNGLLREYFPKGTDFTQVSHQQLARVVKKLNNRPRKCLHYRTPSEVFNCAKNGAL